MSNLIIVLEESLGPSDQLCFFLFRVSLPREHNVSLYWKSCLCRPTLVQQVSAHGQVCLVSAHLTAWPKALSSSLVSRSNKGDSICLNFISSTCSAWEIGILFIEVSSETLALFINCFGTEFIVLFFFQDVTRLGQGLEAWAPGLRWLAKVPLLNNFSETLQLDSHVFLNQPYFLLTSWLHSPSPDRSIVMPLS